MQNYTLGKIQLVTIHGSSTANSCLLLVLQLPLLSILNPHWNYFLILHIKNFIIFSNFGFFTLYRIEEKKFNYVFYDPEMHWCRICDVFPKTAKDYLNHLHTKEHLERDRVETPWHAIMVNNVNLAEIFNLNE